LFGYFPTYTLGNLYAAGLASALEEDQPDLWEQVERGVFDTALEWLRAKVHRRASVVPTATLLRDAIGERDLVDVFVDRLWRRQGALYGVSRGGPG
jgi:carboxypeptidase Taq